MLESQWKSLYNVLIINEVYNILIINEVFTQTVFTMRRSYASAVLGVVILSVHLSVHHTRPLTQPNNALQIF